MSYQATRIDDPLEELHHNGRCTHFLLRFVTIGVKGNSLVVEGVREIMSHI